jgi:YVTN family beta-propeller protein
MMSLGNRGCGTQASRVGRTLAILLLHAGGAIAAGQGIPELGGTLWITDERLNTVTRIEAATGKILAVIPVGKWPVGLSAPAGAGKVYVSEESDDTVSVIDKATARVTKKIKVGSGPHHMHRSPDGSFVYIGL